MVVNEIKMTYFGAEILYRLFSRAREVIHSRPHTSEPITPSGRDASHVAISDDQDEHVEETPGSARPVTWSFNTVNSYGRGTDARYVLPQMWQFDAIGTLLHETNQDLATNMKMRTSTPSLASACFPISQQLRQWVWQVLHTYKIKTPR